MSPALIDPYQVAPAGTMASGDGAVAVLAMIFAIRNDRAEKSSATAPIPAAKNRSITSRFASRMRIKS
jgi:hypothetical protein